MKSKIVEKSLELFLRYGFKTVTMDQLADELGMSKKTLYELFGTKENLIKEALELQFNNIECMLKENNEKYADNSVECMIRIQENIESLIQHETSPTYFQLSKYYPTLHDYCQTTMFQLLDKYFRTTFVRGVEQGYFIPRDAEDLVVFHHAVMMAIKDPKYLEYTNKKSNELRSSFLEYFLNSLLNSSGKQVLNELKVAI